MSTQSVPGVAGLADDPTDRNPVGFAGVLATVSVAFFMTMVDTTAINIAVPDLQDRLDASLGQALWVINGYTLTFAVLLLTFGRLGDRYGHRRVFVAGLVTFTLASGLCGLAQEPSQLIAARMLQGIGAAMLMPQTLAIITTVIPPQRRGVAFGIWSAVAGLATIAGPTLGGVLVDTLTWRSVFLLNLPLGAIAIAATYRLIPHRTPTAAPGRRLDVTAVALSTAGLVLVVFTLIEGQRYEWHPLVLATGGVGITLLGGFWLHQRTRQTKAPLLPFELFARRNFVVMNAVLMAALLATAALLLTATLYLQSVLRLSPTEAGLLLAPPAVATLLISPVAGRLADRLDPRLLLVPGLALFAGGFVLLLAASDTTTGNGLALLPGMAVCGIGTGLVFAPANALAMGDVPPALAGAASGVLTTTRQLGTLLGAAVTGAIIQAGIAGEISAGQALRESYADTMPAALWTVVGVLLLTAIATLRTRPLPSTRNAH